MISRALLAGAAIALAFAIPANGAGIVNAEAGPSPDCQAPAANALDLDISLAVLTPTDLCADVQPTSFRTPAAVAPEPAGTELVASVEPGSSGDVQLVVPLARLVRHPVYVQASVAPSIPAPRLIQVRTTPALTASLTAEAVSSTQPTFRRDKLWMLGAYR